MQTVGKKKTSIEGDAAKTVRQSHSAKIGQVTELYSEFFPATAMIESLLQMMVNLKRDAPEIRKLLQIRARYLVPIHGTIIAELKLRFSQPLTGESASATWIARMTAEARSR